MPFLIEGNIVRTLKRSITVYCKKRHFITFYITLFRHLILYCVSETFFSSGLTSLFVILSLAVVALSSVELAEIEIRFKMYFFMVL